MTRLALVFSALFITLALAAGDTQKQPCEPINADRLQIQTKSEIAVHMVKVFEPINIFAALKKVDKVVPTPKMKPKLKAKKKIKRKSSACGSRRQVWRTLPNGHRKYRCVK